MIVFDLGCGAGHVFEAWFGSTDDYQGQKARGLVQCPLCGSPEVDKAVMAPNVSPKGNSRALAKADAPATPAEMKALLEKVAAAQKEMLANSAYVGRSFATQAREMHLGERDHASIYGEVSRSEAKALVEEGVPVAPLPLPVRPPEQTN